jgi:fermentation-respiration switch protein FrsA (DUF1100 family)
MMLRRSGPVLLALAAAVAILTLALRFGPSLLFATALALPGAEAWLPTAPPPGLEQVSVGTPGAPVLADLYRPARARNAIVLVHGLSRGGRRHPELIRLARLFARRGTLTLVPELEGLVAFRLSGLEVENIRSCVRYLWGIGAGPVALAGFSFGAGPALLAAAELPGLRAVASFGGYADLRNVIRYVTTGVHTHGSRRYVRTQQEYNRWKLLALLVSFVADARDRARLDGIAARKLANPSDPTAALEAGLGPEGRGVMALVQNRREEAVEPLLAALSPGTRAALDRLSPLAAVPRLPGRLLLAHGIEDDSIPFSESLRLAEARGGAVRLVIFRTFHHTGPQPFWPTLGQRLADGFDLVRLVDDLLAA